MASVTDLLKEIKDFDALSLSRRPKSTEVLTGLVQSCATKFGTVANWDTGTHVRVELAIDATHITDDLKIMLHNAAAARTQVTDPYMTYIGPDTCGPQHTNGDERILLLYQPKI
jgi:hypothetical protein